MLPLPVRRALLSASLPLTVVLLSTSMGCASIAEKVASHLAEKGGAFDRSALLISGDTALFRQCLKERGGACDGNPAAAFPQAHTAALQRVEPAPSAMTMEALQRLPSADPARQAGQVLQHPLVQKMAKIHDQLRGTRPIAATTNVAGKSDPSSDTVTFETSVDEVRDLLHRVHATTVSGAWSALTKATRCQLDEATVASPDSASHRAIAQDHRTATYVETYLRAYFRNGQFVELDFEVDAEGGEQRLVESLCREDQAQALCVEAAKALYAKLQKRFGGGRQWLKIADNGFVSRDSSFQARFPGFIADIDPFASHLVEIKEVDAPTAYGSDRSGQYLAVGVDLLRVLIEAIFDAHEGLPALQGATGLSVPGIPLPAFEASSGAVSVADINSMKTLNDRIEAATGVLIDRLIRGIGPISLNNAALEEAIVTLVTTTVRKAMEKATWCWYACDLDQQVANLEQCAKDRARATFANEAREIKLRLKLR